MSTPLLEARGIDKGYPHRGGPGQHWWRRGWSRVLNGVDLSIGAGASVGLVGESGSGKTTLARIIAGLARPDAGTLLWQGRPLTNLDAAARAAWRREVQYVFQNPLPALNPRRRIGASLHGTLRGLTELSDRGRRARIAEVAERVGLEPALLGRFPHQLSGGQAQRVGIARALLGRPRLVILDEPVSALDVSLQAQILGLLETLRADRGLAYLFISHDLAVVERLCPWIAVMRSGTIVEQGPRERILGEPRQPYTRRLLEAVPALARPPSPWGAG